MGRYEVTGRNQVFGHNPGDRFDADIPEVQEQRLVQGGHIRRLPDAKPSKSKVQEPETAGDLDHEEEQ